MAILTTKQILDFITQFTKSKYPQTDVQPGTDLYDLIFHANAQVARRLFEEIERTQNLQSILTTFGSDLDLTARNYNVARKPATFSTGVVTFYASAFSADIEIPINTIISTKGTNLTPPIRFRTLQTIGIPVANKAVYFNTETARYEITARVRAEVTGAIGNVDSQSISELVTAVANINGVVNLTPTTGGIEQETDRALQQRALEAFVVSAIGTIDGYRRLLTSNFDEVQDVKALSPFDTEAVRSTGVDIFTILSDVNDVSNLTQVTESFTYTTGDPGFTFSNQPSISVESVDGTATGVLRSFIPHPEVDADYQFVRDYTSERALSSQSADRIDWLAGIKPDNGSLVVVTHTYNSKLREVQDFLDLDENAVVGADALAKLGLQANATLTLAIGYYAGVDQDAAKEKVSSALSQFLSSKKFGEDLEVSDLIIVAQTGADTDYNITEVDYVVFDESLTSVYIEETDTTRVMTNGIIAINTSEYVREGAITIT